MQSTPSVRLELSMVSPELQDAQSAAAEAMAGIDTTQGSTHFIFDYGQQLPAWAQGTNIPFGPFVKVGRGGDVPAGSQVTLRIYA
jgi:hypothetical protein